MRQWWARWWQVGVPGMLAHRKWTKETEPPAIGEVVYITSPAGGRMGIVEELNKSKDGLVRSAVIKTRSQTERTFRLTTQGVQNLIRLTHSEEDEEKQEDDRKC